MRDVTLWAFTVPFFETREAELEEFEAAMAAMTSRSSLPRPAKVHPDPRHDRPARPHQRAHAGDRGRGGHPHPGAALRRLHAAIPGSEWATTPGGHACVWEHPAAVQPGRSSRSSDAITDA